MKRIRTKTGMTVAGIAITAMMIAVVAIVGAPSLMAQTGEATAEDAVPAPADEAIPAPPAEDTAPSAPAEVATPQRTTAATDTSTDDEADDTIDIEDEKAKPVDMQLEAFKKDLARRTHPDDKCEMITNEHIWYRNMRQLDYNDLPAHKQFPATCGAEWWSDYCGN